MITRSRFVVQLFIVGAAVLFAACTGTSDEGLDPPATITEGESTEDDGPEADGPATEDPGPEGSMAGDAIALPVRDGPRRETTLSVPHVQLDAELVPEVDAELRRRVFSLPGVEDRESTVSLPGARSIWLADDVELARPDVILSGREIGHIHPDGSLHLLLPVDRAIEVAETKWGELHPWVGREDFWDGLVMLYTPETLDEVDITMRLVVDSYNFVTGADIDPEATGGGSGDEQAKAELLAAIGVFVFTDDRVESPIVTVEHEGPVRVVGAASQGDAVATGSGDRTARVWSTTGDLLATLNHADEVRAVRLSADGGRIVTGAADGVATTWSATGERGASLMHADQVNAVAIASDGALAVSGGRDGTAFVFDAETGEVRHELQHAEMVWSVALSPDGEQVATGGADGRGGQARVWDLETGAELEVHEIGQPVDVLSFSPDGRWLFAGGRGGAAILIDAMSGEALPPLEAGFRGGIVDVDWHPDNTELAVTSLGGTHRFELPAGGLADESRVAGGSRGVAYGPDGSWYVTGSGDFQFSFGEIAFWDTATGTKLAALNLGGPVESIAVHADGMVFAGYRTTEDLVEVGGAWLVPGPDRWLALACGATDGNLEAALPDVTDGQALDGATCP